MKVRKPVFYGLLVVIAAGAAFGARLVWLNRCVLRTDDVRIEGTMVHTASRLSDRVIEVLVKEGERIVKGQPLVRLEERNIAARRAEAEASLMLARARYEEAVAGFRPQEILMSEARLNQANAVAERASRDYRRVQSLARNDGGITQADLDASRSAHEAAQAAVASAREELNLRREGTRKEVIQAAEAQMRKAQAELEAINVLYEDTLLRSPVNGTVALKLVSPGELVSAGQHLLTLVNTDDLWLNARIEETRIGQLREGQVVEFTLDGYPGRSFSGAIYEISPAVSSAFSLISTENVAGYFTKVMQRVPIKISLPAQTVPEITFRIGMQGAISAEL